MVRHAEPADAAACAAIYAPAVLDGFVSFEERAPDEVEMRARIEGAAASHAWLVAEERGRVVGFAYAVAHRERAAYRWAADVSAYVDASRRRAGVGRALYAALLELLERQRLRAACAGIALPNPASVALHESLGFVRVGVFPAIGYKAGAWRDVGWWQRRLGAGEERAPPPEPLPPQRLG